MPSKTRNETTLHILLKMGPIVQHQLCMTFSAFRKFKLRFKGKCTFAEWVSSYEEVVKLKGEVAELRKRLASQEEVIRNIALEKGRASSPEPSLKKVTATKDDLSTFREKVMEYNKSADNPSKISNMSRLKEFLHSEEAKRFGLGPDSFENIKVFEADGYLSCIGGEYKRALHPSSLWGEVELVRDWASNEAFETDPRHGYQWTGKPWAIYTDTAKRQRKS
ncbi:unknown [Feldmannia species virus]|uniref:Uncharacterized protein n=1 Tax=Feldmannia species virus TaxID=39420 RepID=B5LWC5_9PHYC|nr:hypothetical protein FeldSpV_gp036 [Feldmannia species virus]ACH46788.1 unknown [Feldmannia species virus]